MGHQVIHILSSAPHLNIDLFALQNTTRMNGTFLRSSCLTSIPRIGGLSSPMKEMRRRFFLSAANDDRVTTEYSNEEATLAERSELEDGSSTLNPPSMNSSEKDGETLPKGKDGSSAPLSEVNNGSLASRSSNENQKPAFKRSPLTAREKLRAARVLSRYTESKASKPELGSKLLDALKESEKGKRRSGLPEAPTNLFDDSKRGLPKPGWTFEFPGGFDVFLIAFSFVFISSVMFATTYIVWKAGGIHFNEY